jgi:membrane protease YdiL (CAAX protease family)
VAATNSTPYSFAVPPARALRELAELILGFLAIIAVLWLPSHEQAIFGPIALFTPLVLVLVRSPSLNDLGLGVRGFISSLWILPAAVALAILSVLVAQNIGTFHMLYEPDFSHVAGYVVWTLYQQFLLQDYFMPRLTRVLSSDAAIAAAAVLFALAHLPNLSLVIGTLIWGAVSCALFRRYRSLWVLGITQGLLGLCFAICVPDAMHHHMRVGLGYLHYVGAHSHS